MNRERCGRCGVVFYGEESGGYFISDKTIKENTSLQLIDSITLRHLLIGIIKERGTRAVKCPQCDLIQVKATEPTRNKI